MPFKFIVNSHPLYIHADLVSHHSKPLDRLMNGHMAEAQQGYAVFEDVDAKTFALFIQWAYSGFYSAPDFDTVTTRLSCEEPSTDGDAAIDWLPAAYEDKPAEEVMPVEEDSYLHGYSFGGSHNSKRASKMKGKLSYNNEPTTKNSSKDVLKDSFVFADKYQIDSLKLLALEELQITLAKFTLYSERTGDIVELLRYIYANSGESVPGVEDLRTLTTHYVGYEMDMLMRDENFKALMIEDGGPLLRDFMGMVRKRIL